MNLHNRLVLKVIREYRIFFALYTGKNVEICVVSDLRGFRSVTQFFINLGELSLFQILYKASNNKIKTLACQLFICYFGIKNSDRVRHSVLSCMETIKFNHSIA